MGLLDELKRALNLDDDPNDRSKLDALGLEPRPALDPRRWDLPTEAPEIRAANAEERLNPGKGVMVPPPPPRPADRNYGERAQRKSPEMLRLELEDAGAKNVEGEVAKSSGAHNGPDLADLAGPGDDQADGPPPPSDAVSRAGRAAKLLETAKGRVAGAGRFLGPARASDASKSEPPGKAGDDTGKADLLTAIGKVAKPPESMAETPAPAEGERPRPEVGGPLGSLSKMLMGAGGSDPRTDGLRAALERSTEMKRMAGHITGMGIGADLAEGVHVHGDQGKGLRDRADDEVRNAMLPTEFEQKNARFDTDQARSAQEMRLKDSSEGRAQQGELRAEGADRRAQAGEQRTQKTFDTTQGYTDPKSETSANARASIEAVYPQAWKKIPEERRNNFSAKDVERIFGEVKPSDFAPKGPGKQGGIDQRQARALAAKAKLNDPGMVSAMNDILATLDSGSAPGTGYFMNEGGWQNFLRTQAGKEFRQAMFTVMNPYIKEVHGANVTENELERAMAQFGYGNFDDPESLAAGMRRVAKGMEAKQDQHLKQLPPESRKMLEDAGAASHVDSKTGKVLKGDITDEQQLKDAVDFPESLKPVIGILGAAKQWLSGGRRGTAARRDYHFDAD